VLGGFFRSVLASPMVTMAKFVGFWALFCVLEVWVIMKINHSFSRIAILACLIFGPAEGCAGSAQLGAVSLFD
jgi:hypothetical protein